MPLNLNVSVTLSIAILLLVHVVSKAQSPQSVSLGEELYRAAEAADIAKVKDLIAQGADVNARDGAALRDACGSKLGGIAVVQALLDAGADPNAGGGAALWSGVANYNLPCVQILLDKGADPNLGAKHKSPVLIEAVLGNVDKVSMVKALLAKGANPNLEDLEGNTAVSAALGAHDRAVAKSHFFKGGREVLPNGIVVDWKERVKNYEEILDLLGAASAAMPKPEIKTLADAVAAGDVAKVDVFLADGADPKVKDDDGMNPLHLAAVRGHADVVSKLLKAGADINARGQHGATPLILASQEGHLDVVNLLLEAKANVNAFDDGHQTALMVAVGWKHIEVARLLLSHGADPNAHEGDGYTAMFFAVMTGQKDAQQLLRRAGAK